MLANLAFNAALHAVNNSIWLAPPTAVKRTSSMMPLVNALAAYNLAANGANLLALVTALGAVPAPKRARYTVALNALYASFPTPIYVSAAPFALSTAPGVPGIGVRLSANVRSHQVDAILALRQLHNIPSGQALLVAIVNNTGGVAPKRVGIQDAANTASGGNECRALAVPPPAVPGDAQNRVCEALINGHVGVGAVIGAAMAARGHVPAAAGSYAWLEAQINGTPIYQLQGLPNATPSAVVHGPGWISAVFLQNWVTGVTAFPTGLAGGRVNDAMVVLGAVLAGAAPGAGTHSIVYWNASNAMVLGVARPPFIGLGHELIHAFHDQMGDQPGGDNGHPTTALYEYLCVGLGPFAGAAHTENGLRAAAGLAARTRYA